MMLPARNAGTELGILRFAALSRFHPSGEGQNPQRNVAPIATFRNGAPARQRGGTQATPAGRTRRPSLHSASCFSCQLHPFPCTISHSGTRFPGQTPQIHRRVRPPWTPWLGATLEFARTFERQRAQQAKIARRERIGLAQGSQCDILRGPVSDAWDLAETPEKICGVHNSFEVDLAARDCAGQGADGFGSRSGQADGGEPGALQRLN